MISKLMPIINSLKHFYNYFTINYVLISYKTN